MNLLQPEPHHEKIFSNKIMTCFTQEHGLTCGLTNQLFELATCLAISTKLGSKQFILPSIGSDGNWGLCYCSKSQRYSTFFDLERMKKLAKQRFGLTIYEYKESQTLLQDVSEELFRLQDNTLYLKPL